MTENNKKKIRKEFISIDVTNLEDEQIDEILKKHVGALADLYRKKCDDIKVERVEKKLEKEHLSDVDQLVITGVVEETQEEFDFRMGIDRSNSWDVIYADIANCSQEVAKNEMAEMLASGFVVSPEAWMKNKMDKVKEVLNSEDGE
jgi:site-specific recombinase